MNADQKMAAIQVNLDAAFQKRMDATPKDASLETWHQSRALAYVEQTGLLRYELKKTLREIDALHEAAKRLQSQLDGSAGFCDLETNDGEYGMSAKLGDSHCLLDVTAEGHAQTVYIAGGWVDADFFADKAHKSWARQIEALRGAA